MIGQAAKRLIAEFVDILGETRDQLRVRCPGWESHTTGGVEADVKMFGGRPVLGCFHVSCRAEVQSVNHEMWARLDELPEEELPELSPEEIAVAKAESEFRAHLKHLKWVGLKRLLPSLKPVPLEHWLNTSPVRLVGEPYEDWRLFLSGLFEPEDLVWCGERFDSGPEHTENFRTVNKWLNRKYPWGPLVSVATFNGQVLQSGERKRSSMRWKRYHIIELDHTPSYETQGAVIAWTRRHLHLRAIVDTGGKSLHALFQQPQWSWWPAYDKADPYAARRSRDIQRQRWTEQYYELRKLWALLEGAGCDPAMFDRCLTTRLPGVERNVETKVNIQQLLYLDPLYGSFIPGVETASEKVSKIDYASKTF
jgi:hypothetical protein